MTVRDLAACIEILAHPALQEDYDNSGLIIGSPDTSVNAALITLDVTERVIDEAVRKGAGMIISHHPPVFNGLKRLTGRDVTERIVFKAIRENIALYAIHTNLDNSVNGINRAIGEKLGLAGLTILEPVKRRLMKLVFFVPPSHARIVCQAVFDAGAGTIGNYDWCSFSVDGQGSFRAGEGAKPFTGNVNVLHHENEQRIEVILPAFLQQSVIHALIKAHPYEEPAFDLYPIENQWTNAGSGMIGELAVAIPENQLLNTIKSLFGCKCLRHTDLLNRPVKKIAVCGGSGSFLIPAAIARGADAFITADIRYHQYFEADRRILLIDAGHYETEQFVKELLYNHIIKKFPNFALHLSEINTNPINYY